MHAALLGKCIIITYYTFDIFCVFQTYFVYFNQSSLWPSVLALSGLAYNVFPFVAVVAIFNQEVFSQPRFQFNWILP